MNLSIKSFRIISTLEAISFLVLLGIAMPLKYIAKIEAGEEIVRVVGMLHGLLFIGYVLGTFIMKEKLKWSIPTLLIVILCSVLPFGPFYVERKYL
ncbi:MAG: DUF3817 domain-containing protein [Flavobacteriaceae bacterium]|nr:DUF3817 domain-containing protein [Flavobacteriaceae bacterium]